MALTHQQEEEIRRRLMRGDPVFRIAIDLFHSPRTVRKRKKRLNEELGQAGRAQPLGSAAVFIPVELGLVIDMAAEKAIGTNYQVLLPVPLEVAAGYVQIEKFFLKLEGLWDDTVEGIRKRMDESTDVGG